MDMPLRVCIVDDEAHVREELEYLLSEYSQIQVAGTADNAFDALRDIQALAPQAVFLDIRLGDVDGLTLARKLRKTMPQLHIVFVTALEQHAVEGFELEAVDYVLKPITRARLARTVARLLDGRDTAPVPPPPPVHTDKIVVKHQHVWKLISLGDVSFFQAQDHCTTAHTPGEAFPLNQTLRELQQQLDPKRFLRTHKSFIVSISAVDEIIPWFNYTYKIRLKRHSAEIPVSRSYMKEFRARFNL